jgi:hypothetical protein
MKRPPEIGVTVRGTDRDGDAIAAFLRRERAGEILLPRDFAIVAIGEPYAVGIIDFREGASCKIELDSLHAPQASRLISIAELGGSRRRHLSHGCVIGRENRLHSLRLARCGHGCDRDECEGAGGKHARSIPLDCKQFSRAL